MISVIVPVYNSEKYLRKCVDSILGQTYKDIELILVNDASTDRSEEICRHYEQEHFNVHVYTLKKNSGQVSAYIKGIEMASGEWIGFVDSDDWIEKTMYESLMHSQVKHNTDISCCGIFMDFSQISYVEPEKIEEYEDLVLNHDQVVEEFKELHTSQNKISEIYKLYRCNKIYKRKLVEDNIQYCQREIRVFEDNNLVIPCLLDAKSISYAGKPLYHYVRRENSTMGTFRDDILQSNRNFLNNLKKIYSEKGVLHFFDSDAWVTTSFSLNGILMSKASWKKKFLQLRQLQNDIKEYNLTKDVCISFGSSRKLAVMIRWLQRGNIWTVLVMGELYKKVKQVKNENHFK